MSIMRPATNSIILTGTGYRDWLTPGTTAGVGAASPTYEAFVGNLSFFRGYTFSQTTDDELLFIVHPNHDYKPNTPISFHVHWSPTTTDAGNVVFQWTYSYARGYSVDTFSASSTVQLTAAASGAINTHIISETTDQTVANLETDGILAFSFKRLGSNGSDTYPAKIQIYTLDVHYQTDRFATSNKQRGSGWDP